MREVLLDQIDGAGLYPSPDSSFQVLPLASYLPAQVGDMDHIDACWTQQDHRHRDATLTKRHIADQGIALFQLAVKEGNDGFLCLQFVGPVEPKLKHALKALLDTKFTFFIEKRGFINDFHRSLKNRCLFQFIVVCFRACRDDFLAVAIQHLHRLFLDFKGACQEFLTFPDHKFLPIFESFQKFFAINQNAV